MAGRGRSGYASAVENLLLTQKRYRLEFRSPLRTAHGVWTHREGVLFRAETADGRVGWAEAAPVPGFGAGGPEGELSRLMRTASAAAMAEAHAGGGSPGAASSAAPPALPVAALLPAGRRALAAAASLAEAGFRTFKWKVGVADWREEIGLLDDLLAALPGGARLRLDANGAWDRRTAGRWLERCAERPIEFVEQPVAAAGDPGGWGRAADSLLGLAGDYPTLIGLDESLAGEEDVERWIGAGWRGVFVVKPSLFSDAAKALDRLAAAKADVVFSSALETAVGARHALRLAFGWRGDSRRALGFGVYPLFADGRFDGPASAPFIRPDDVERIRPETAWNALA